MPGISDAAESIGFHTKGYHLSWEQLRDEVPLSCTVHLNQRYFVVVYRVKKRGAGSRGQRAKIYSFSCSPLRLAGSMYRYI